MNKSRRPIVGVMGPGNPPNKTVLDTALEIGKQIAQHKWILLTGGRKAGVMDAASKGAAEAGGEVIGILPNESKSGMSEHVSIPIVTGVGSARNFINILTADVVIICGMGLGTASEAALAIKYQKPVIFTGIKKSELEFFQSYSKKQLPLFEDTSSLFNFIEKRISRYNRI